MNPKVYILLLITTSFAFGKEKGVSTPIIDLEPYVIRSSPLAPKLDELTQAWSGLEGNAFERVKASTLGETLSLQPGVTPSFYGPNANRPILRGLDGQRIRILQNGLDTFDVSGASVDHAVTVDPLLVERVEILRGSSALLYGSNAIGGVVNTIDRTIPTHPANDGMEGQARLSHTSVNDGWNSGAVVFTDNDRFVVQAHGTFRQTNDYDVSSVWPKILNYRYGLILGLI